MAERFTPDLVEESPDALFSLSHARVVLSWNRGAQAMFGFTSNEAIGRPLDLLIVPPEHHAEARHFTDIAIACGDTLFETIRRHKDGSPLCVDVSMRACSPKNAEPFLVVSKKNVTALRGTMAPTQTQLDRNFVTTMTHELRSPLNAIIGFTSLMYKGKAGPVSKTQLEFLQDVATSANDLMHMIGGLDELAKATAARLRPEPTELASLVDEVCERVREDASRRQIRIATQIDVANVVVDRSAVKQVLAHYLTNAIEYGPDGGTVTIRAIAADDRASFRLEVQDTGPGIADSDLPKLFAGWCRLGRSRRRGGLGLLTAKQLVERHGGTVGVTSAPGEGSTFWACLPHVLGAGARDAR